MFKKIFEIRNYPIWLKVFLFAPTYFIFMVIGYEFYYSPDNVAMFWPASGLLLSVLLLSNQRNWVLYVIVVIISQIWVDQIYYERLWYLGVLFGLANSLEALVGAIFIKRFFKISMDAFTFKFFFAIIVLGALFSPVFSATLGSFIIIYAYGSDIAAYWSIWQVWWAADFLGILIVVPAILSWQSINPALYKSVTNKKKFLELCALIVSMVFIEQYLFGSQFIGISRFYDLPYILIPFLLWATYSFSPRTVTGIIFFLVFLTIWNTDMDRGVFVYLSNTPNEVIISLQSFLSITTISILFLVVLVNELRKSQHDLKVLNQDLEQRVYIRTKQLNEMNEELEAFSYSVSHDLQAPLRSIVSFSEILREEFQDSLPGDGVTYLDKIINSGFKMQGLIQSLLLLSRINRNELIVTSIKISDLVKKIINELEISNLGTMPEYEVLVLECGFVEGDVQLLEIALRNLVTNAIKFSKPNQKTEITFGTIEGINPRIFFIRDNGIGIDMQYKEKIFEPFQRLYSDNKFSGMGIGLSIVQRVIRRHGGNIWVESEIEKGTTFFFTLDSSYP